MKYCKFCGACMNDSASFCPNCGGEVSGDSQIVEREIKSFDNLGIKERSIVAAIIFSIITCGIYSIYWMIKLNDEILSVSKEKGQSGVVVFLFSILTCGIYSYFWNYKMGTCIDKIKGNQNGNTGILYIILSLVGLNIVGMVLMQDALNNKING